MKFLGHKNIKNTLLYIDLEQACYPYNSDDYHAKVAKTGQEVCKLVEAGFEYVCDVNHGKIFRKRK
jgi:hypothetical protein